MDSEDEKMNSWLDSILGIDTWDQQNQNQQNQNQQNQNQQNQNQQSTFLLEPVNNNPDALVNKQPVDKDKQSLLHQKRRNARLRQRKSRLKKSNAEKDEASISSITRLNSRIETISSQLNELQKTLDVVVQLLEDEL